MEDNITDVNAAIQFLNKIEPNLSRSRYASNKKMTCTHVLAGSIDFCKGIKTGKALDH